MKTTFAVILLITTILVSLSAFAHGGGLDDLGCNYNRMAGGYHCHRGPLAGRQFGSKQEAQRASQSAPSSPSPSPNLETSPDTKAGYVAVILSVYDGDTFTAQVRIWPGHIVKDRIRVSNIDAPEIKGKCASETELAIQARDFARKFLGREALLSISWDRPRDRYGRILATVANVEGKDLGEALIQSGLARRWAGQRRSWCK